MTTHVLHALAKPFSRPVPEIKPGFTVRVHERVQEGNKERIQAFEGLVINVHNGHVPTDASFTVRKIVSGIGVEKVFPLLSPRIEKIEVKKVAKTRRSKLFFIRGRSGKSARMIERFTTEGEFAAKADEPMVPEEGVAEMVTEENIVEAPAVAETPADNPAEDAPKTEAPVEAVAEEKKEEPAA